MKDTQDLAGELLIELEKLGVIFELTGEKLKYKDSKGNFSVGYKEKVKKYKKEIIEILKKEETAKKILVSEETGIKEYPLTEVQTAYLIGKTEAVKWGGIGCQGYIEVNFGTHTTEELASAWELLVNRHEMLRTRVSENGFEVLEREKIKYEIEILDLRQASKEEKEDVLSKLRNKFNIYVFDTKNPPLFKVVITQQAEGNFLHLLIDLIISDFASVQLLVSEMGQILKGIPLKAVTTKFSDYALFNQQRKGSLKWYRDRAYWLKRLEDLPEGPSLPRDGRAATGCKDSHEFYHFQEHVDNMTWGRIKEVAGECGVTVSSVLIGVYAEVIARWCDNKCFTLNLPIQNRPNVVDDINTIVGDFTTVNLLAMDITRNISFEERVKEISRQLIDDLEHNSFSGVEVLRELNKRTEKKELLMPVVFTGVLKSKNDVGTIEYGFSHTPQVWIDCQVVDESDTVDKSKGLMISWDVRKGTVKKTIVTEMFNTFIETVKFLGTKRATDWKMALEVVVPELNKKIVSCKPVKMVTDCPFIQQGFIEYARRNPEKVAVIHAFEKVTYGELLRRAKCIAGYLRKEFGIGNEKLIAIRMKKSVGQIAAVMGVLIAGFAYLPIDIKQPLVRQEKIIIKSEAVAELNEKIVGKILSASECYLEEYSDHRNPTAYVIFTSGSTGEPKGVKMSHTAAQNTILALKDIYNIAEGDIVLGIAELSFDLSVFDIFGVLGSGGILILPDPEKGPDASHWGKLINEYNVTLWNTVPAQAEMLEAFAEKTETYLSVRLVLLSGDWINPSLPTRLRKIMPNAKIISLGGATEGGIWSIYHEIDEIQEAPTILYGKALPGQWMGVVDEALRICPRYVTGQIAIGGYSLADGYLDDDKLTEEKFVYIDGGKNRIYLTGDNGRYVEDDDIEFLGRMDNQVKINGHRIEIAEIEAALRELSQVEDCCVAYHRSGNRGKLVAFIKEKMDQSKRTLDSLECIDNQLSAESLEEFNRILEKAVCGTVYEKISGAFRGRQSLSKEEIMQWIGVQAKYKELLKRWLGILVTHDYLQEKNGRYELSEKEGDTTEYWESLRQIPYTNIAPDTVSKYIQNHAESICELFKGTVNPLIFLFPEGKTEIAEALYGETAIAKYLNAIISDFVRKYAKYFEQIKILEVGGGIGATTKQILEKTNELGYDYLFTDVSYFFLNNIKKQYPQVKTALLNLDEWEPSTFEKFHVIIAAGVLNNTKNIPEAIGKLGSILYDEGVLLITDPVGEHIEITVSQAFMMPEHSDIRALTGHCFLNETEWDKTFNSAGLEVLQAFPTENNECIKFKQKLFIVRKKRKDYKEYLKTMLPAAMIPKEFVPIDRIPLSGNGKVDRETLLKTWETGAYSKSLIINEEQVTKKESYSGLDNKVLEIIRAVSGNNNITYEDNLLENGFDSLLLSQVAGKIVNEIPEAKGLRFDEILRIALAEPTIIEIAKYVKEKNDETDTAIKTENDVTQTNVQVGHKAVYVLGEDKAEWGAALTKTLTTTDVFVKEVSRKRLKTEIKKDTEVKSKWLFISQANISEILVEIGELLAQGITIERVFLLNPERAKDNDLYLGDMVILNGTQIAIDSWKEAALGGVEAYEVNFDEICGVIKKEIINEG